MDTPPIPNVAALVDLLGGTQRAMTLLGISRALLFLWEHEGVPAKRWQQVTELLRINGHADVTIETISKIRPTRSKESKGKGGRKRKARTADRTDDAVAPVEKAA
jgi:hypothetical protein